MLEEFAYTMNPLPVGQMLQRFDVPAPLEKGSIELLEYKTLSPDSAIWKFLILDEVYFLYTEEFIGDLDDVKTKIQNHNGFNNQLEFIERRDEADDNFLEEDQHTHTVAVKEAIDSSNVVVEDGEFCVFLLRSDEDPREVY